MGSQTSKQIIKRKYPSQHVAVAQKFPEATPEGTTSTRARETRDQGCLTRLANLSASGIDQTILVVNSPLTYIRLHS